MLRSDQPMTREFERDLTISLERSAATGRLLEGVNIVVQEASRVIDGAVDHAREFQSSHRAYKRRSETLLRNLRRTERDLEAHKEEDAEAIEALRTALNVLTSNPAGAHAHIEKAINILTGNLTPENTPDLPF